jgi:hypothetical protein
MCKIFGEWKGDRAPLENIRRAWSTTEEGRKSLDVPIPPGSRR